jgi:hypothetical protein
MSGGLETHDTGATNMLFDVPLIYTTQPPAQVPVIVTPHKVFALWPDPHAKYFV